MYTVHDIFVSARRRKEAMPGASLTDDNAAMAEIASAVCTVNSAMLYENGGLSCCRFPVVSNVCLLFRIAVE